MSRSGSAPAQHKEVYPAISPDILASSMYGRNILVTGAGRGIGRAIALSFAQAGASGIALLSRTESELKSVASEIANLHPDTRTLVCIVDVTDRNAMASAVKNVERDLGAINVVVANAGMNLFRPYAYTPGEDWWRVIEVNLKAPMMLAEIVLPAMRVRNEGVIIFSASRAGIESAPAASSYTVSKTALIRACSTLQLELDTEAGGASGIHLYAIHPGSVKSNLTLESLHPDLDKMRAGLTNFIRSMYEIRFIHPPELCGQTCVYLATGRAAALRGRYIDVGDDIEDLVKQADLIRTENMYDLTIKKLG